ncbi:MAG: hypothetical protein P8182_09200 [Deltaproteobacteria bacterium]
MNRPLFEIIDDRFANGVLIEFAGNARIRAIQDIKNQLVRTISENFVLI